MKHLILILFFSYINLSSFAQIKKAEIIAIGLTCSMCSNAINKQLKTIDNVDSVITDLNTNTFSVYLKSENTSEPNMFKEKVEKAGFFIGSLILELNSNILTTENSAFININKQEIKNKNVSTIKILDKGYVTEREYKKLVKQYAKIESYSKEDENNYHFKIIN